MSIASWISTAKVAWALATRAGAVIKTLQPEALDANEDRAVSLQEIADALPRAVEASGAGRRIILVLKQ